MMKLLVVSTLAFAVSCSAVSTAPPSTFTASPGTGATAPASPSASALPGSTFSMPTERAMVSFHADRGSLIALTTKEGPSPFESKIFRAEAPSGPWREIYQSDALFILEKVFAARIGAIEYREPPDGRGAFSETIVVVDLATGQKTQVDHFALSAATYRGGGGAPRRPSGSLALGPDRIAWTRLVEGANGSVSGELRVAPITSPTRFETIASSTEWIAPVGLDAGRLVYVLGGKSRDELHVRDLRTGSDRTIATASVGDGPATGGTGLTPAVSGDWAVWLDEPWAASAKVRAANLATGEQRTLAVNGSQCASPTAGSRYFAWSCSKSVASDPQPFVVLDAKTLQPADAIPAGTGLQVVAADDGLVWLNVVGETRQVTLFRPN
jgi:hypothetical protein